MKYRKIKLQKGSKKGFEALQGHVKNTNTT